MADYPCIVSARMVLALLKGDKTQTRRLPTAMWDKIEPGDRLYVREAYQYVRTEQTSRHWPHNCLCNPWHYINYTADGEQYGIPGSDIIAPKIGPHPSIHMPRDFSRLTLTITDVRRQRVQDITEDDAKAEGLTLYKTYKGADGPVEAWTYEGLDGVSSPSLVFAHLWDSLHTKPGARWQDNPEIIPLTFTVHKGNIDQLDGRTHTETPDA